MAYRSLPLGLALLAGCGGGMNGDGGTATVQFGNPQRVTITAYTGSASEPVLTPDGQSLLFDSRQDKGPAPQDYWAKRVDDTTFTFMGAIHVSGAQPILVTSMDDANNLYFVGMPVSSESVFHGLWDDTGAVTGAVPVSGVDLVTGNWPMSGVAPVDPFISHDGKTLIFDEFTDNPSGSATCVTLRLALKNADGSFAQLADGDARLAAFYSEFGNIYKDNNINKCLSDITGTYSLSHNGLMALVGKIDFASGLDRLFLATRSSTSDPFDAPQLLAAADGQIVENGSFSPDDSRIYYHRSEPAGSPNEFSIWTVSRQ